ncbi:hypothetical protein NDU88_001690 [Pleurodeles waltl]|uniref:Uncharacterized protein n=2 Tax=Pleurodeles waltl TaxID=8319 RepID=A0AAV7WMH7_PLEWA|nr:hypothetical protein NDU88_001690 [Pleurodeles waltl]
MCASKHKLMVLGGPEAGGEGVPGLGRQEGERSPTRRGAADARDGSECEARGTEEAGGDVEAEASVEVFRSLVVEGFVCVGEKSKGDPFADWEPMQVSQVCGDVAVAGHVEDEAGRGVLNALQAILEFGCGPSVEGVAVVQVARDEGVGHGFSSVGEDPAEDLAEHAEGEEAGGGHGVDLLGYGEKRVQDEAEVAGVVCGGRCGAEGRGPPGVVPGGRDVAEDEDFRFFRVQL